MKDGIRCTHNGTGGSSTLTLARINGWRMPQDMLGSSGVVTDFYSIVEGTDSTFAQINQYERGYGSLDLSTGILTRSLVRDTGINTSGLGTITSNDKNPSALTFTNTAANIRIGFGGNVDTMMGALPGVQNAGGSGFSGTTLGFRSFNTRHMWDSNNFSFTLTAGDKLWVPFEYRGGLITKVGVYCATLHAGAALRMAMYNWDTDFLMGGLIEEFTSSSQIALTATGLASITAASPANPSPGPYWMCLQSNDSTAAIVKCTHVGESWAGISTGQRDVMYYTKSGTYGALPSTGDKTASSPTTRSSGGQPWFGFQ